MYYKAPPPLTHIKFTGIQGSFGAYRYLKENEPDRLAEVLTGYRNAVRDGWNSRTFMETYLPEYIYTNNLSWWVGSFIQAARKDGSPDLDMRFKNFRTIVAGRPIEVLMQRIRLGGAGVYQIAKLEGWLDTIYDIHIDCVGDSNQRTRSFIQKLVLKLPPKFEEVYNKKKKNSRPDGWWRYFVKAANKDNEEYAKHPGRVWHMFPRHLSPFHKPGIKHRRQDNWTHKDCDPI